MHRRQRRRHIRKSSHNHHYSAIAALWSLRILVDLDGWTELPPHELTSDGRLLRTIGLESFEDEEANRKVFLQRLKERQTQVEDGKPALDGVLGENLEKFRPPDLREKNYDPNFMTRRRFVPGKQVSVSLSSSHSF